MVVGRFISQVYQRWYEQRKTQYFKQKIAHYLQDGRKPWSPGYQEFKWQFIEQAIADSNIIKCFGDNLDLPPNYGQFLDERVVEYPWLMSRLCSEDIAGHFLDAGSSLNYRCLVEHPRLAQHHLYCVTLAPEANCFWQQGVSYVYTDLRDLPFQDEFFEGVASISTLEHIGMDNKMLYTSETNYQENKPQDYLVAVKELKRVLKKGHKCFITLPFGRYQYDVFQQQFDRTMLEQVKQTFAPTHYQETFFQYNREGWFISTREDCQDCEYFNFHKTKYCDPDSSRDYDPDLAAAARSVVALEMIK